MSERTTHWTSIGVFATGLEADIAREALEDADIPVLVRGDQPGIFGSGFQGTVPGGIELLVPDTALLQARERLGRDDD